MSAVKSFADLFAESLEQTKMKQGSIISGTVTNIDKNARLVIVSCPFVKSDGVIAIDQFYDENGEVEVQIGDEVDVALDEFEDGFGETILSRERAKRIVAWENLAKAHESNDTVTGIITGRVKGGFTVEINKVRAFLPGSLVDVRPVRDPSYLEGKALDFKIIKVDRKRNNIVVSRRAVVEAESSAERDALLENLMEGQEVKGIVKNLTDYGVFIDLGGIDGLLHITDMSWKRIKHPSEMLGIGDEILVKVLKFDKDKNRVSLGLKQLGDDPWRHIADRYPVGTKFTGKVTNLTDYGCFVELEEGVEGLVHVSEMDWTNKNINPKKVVHLEQEVAVMVLEIDPDKRRISLGIKQCQSNPWVSFSENHKEGEVLSGKIKSITDFGIFIGLDGDIDGLVHLSDISWTATGEQAIRDFKKGQDIEAAILGIDADRERISLGIKQLESDPFQDFLKTNPENSLIAAKVKEVSAKRAVLALTDSIDGYLPVSEFSRERVADLREMVNVDDEIEAMIMGVDSKGRGIALSIKAKDAPLGKQDGAESSSAGSAPEPISATTTLGDLLKEQMANSKEAD